MITFIRMPEIERALYNSWKSEAKYGRKQWIDRAQDSEELYYHDVDDTGTTFSSEQLQIIKDHHDIPVSINWLHPTANQKLALLTQVKHSMRTVSLDGRAKQHAMVLDKMKHGVWYYSNADLEVQNMGKDMLISGQGHIMVMSSDFYKPGIFNIKIGHVPYDEVILDINAKKRDLSDMEGFFIEKQFTVPKFQVLYGSIFNELVHPDGRAAQVADFTDGGWAETEGMTHTQQVITTQWDSESRVNVREFYTKKYTNMYMVPNPETGITDYVFEENLSDVEVSILASATDVVPDVYIQRNIYFGDFLVWTEMMPITDFPLKTAFFEWGGKPYRSYGMIHFVKDMQAAYDKVIQMMLVNGILTNNAGWNGPRGSLDDTMKKNWQKYGNNPFYFKEYDIIVREGQAFKPEKDQVTQLGNFYPMLLELIKQGIEYSTGITPILQGNANEAGVEVFSSLQQYQNAAMMRIVMSSAQMNNVLKDLGNVLIEMMVANLSPNEYQFFDEKGELNELSLALEVVNGIKQFKYMVLSVPSTAMPTQRLAVSSELMKIAQSSPDPVERSLYTQTAMQMSDIREFDDLTEKLDVVKNTEGKLNQLQEAYNRLLETSKQMENKYINISLENRILKSITDSEKEVAVAAQKAQGDIELEKELAKGKIQGEQKT